MAQLEPAKLSDHNSNIRQMMPKGNNALFNDDDSEDDDETAQTTFDEDRQSDDEEIVDDGRKTQTDRYGFYLDAGKQTMALSQEQIHQRRMKEKSREVKWARMRSNWKTYSKKDGGKRKLKSRIRKGIPDSLRGEIWDVLSRVKQLKKEHTKGRYQQLCVAAHRKALKDNKDGNVNNNNGSGPFPTIERDLGRTFPRHSMFYDDEGGGNDSGGGGGSVSEPSGIVRLRRLLRAYAMYDPEIGYCQGMSFFCAMFLIYRPAPSSSNGRRNSNEIDEGEERAFWQLVSVMHRPCHGIRKLYASDMAECKLCLHTFQKLAMLHLPNIARHIEDEGLVFSMFATSWYMTIFSSSFPFDLVTRVWDAFLAEGFKIIHRVALALLKCFSDVILSLGFEELISFLQHDLPNRIDPDLVMQTAFRIPLKKVQIEAIAEQYHAEEATY